MVVVHDDLVGVGSAQVEGRFLNSQCQEDCTDHWGLELAFPFTGLASHLSLRFLTVGWGYVFPFHSIVRKIKKDDIPNTFSTV